VAGCFLLLDDEHYVIEMSDNGIPVSLIENTELNKCPLNWNVVLDSVEDQLLAFLDEVQYEKVVRNSPDEPLFRLKITHLVQSGFYTDGTRTFCLHVFHLNPMYDGTKWAERDREGVEVAFRIEADKKPKFLDAWHDEDFINVKR
jgi:hypothetical protein